GRAASLRQHPRPGDREAIGIEAEIAHQRHIVGIAMIVVARDVSGIIVADAAGRPQIDIPDAVGPTVAMRRAFDLEGRGGCAPDEAWTGGHKRWACTGTNGRMMQIADVEPLTGINPARLAGADRKSV